MSQVEDPTRAQAIASIKPAGAFSKAETSMILFLIVSETLAPARTAPKNSQMAARNIA